jgi:hypothetical protein
MRPVLTAIALLASLPAHADSWVAKYAQLRPEVQQACNRHDLVACHSGLLELARLLDDRQDVLYKLARVEAELGLTGLALQRLEIYARSGLDLGDPSTEPAFAALRQNVAFGRIVDLYRASGKAAVVAHERIATLGDSDLVAEDIVCNRGGGSFLVSSVRQRKVLQVGASGGVSDLITQQRVPLWGVFALAEDPHRETLWATTATSAVSPPYTPQEADRSAVFALDRRSGAVLARYELPGGERHAFGDMTVAPDGTVYISDGLGGGIYTVRPVTRPRLETLVEPGNLGSPQTPALSRDGSTLLVPDYQRGIARVALRRRSMSWLQRPPELALFGIDGMYLEGRTLVAIQNGTAPERIVMLRLNRTLDRVESWRVLLARVPGLGDPTHGCLRRGDFYFIANSGWDQFDDDGARTAGAVLTAPEIWRIRIPAPP